MSDTLFEAGVQKDAFVSRDGVYRYTLTRRWKGDSIFGMANFILLNPSTADASVDDPTVRKCMGFARRWGLPGVTITNLFAFRATDPANMKAATNPIGYGEPDFLLLSYAGAASVVVLGWGEHGEHLGRGDEVRRKLHAEGVACTALRLNASGQPAHPLYLPYELRPFPLPPPRLTATDHD